MKFLSLVAIFPLLVTSCASDSGKKNSSPSSAVAARPSGASPEEKFNSWAGGMSKDNGFVKDANGNLVPKSNKRSSFERKGQDPNFAGKSFEKKEYHTGDYTKKSFWGTKEYDRKAYAGNTDGSRFQKDSNLQGKGARESGTAAKVPGDYKTDNYATNSARESGLAPIKKGSNDAIENRRKVFVEPEIITWQEQRKLTVDQSKGILGR